MHRKGGIKRADIKEKSPGRGEGRGRLFSRDVSQSGRVHRYCIGGDAVRSKKLLPRSALNQLP